MARWRRSPAPGCAAVPSCYAALAGWPTSRATVSPEVQRVTVYLILMKMLARAGKALKFIGPKPSRSGSYYGENRFAICSTEVLAPGDEAEPDSGDRFVFFGREAAHANSTERASVRGRDRHPTLHSD